MITGGTAIAERNLMMKLTIPVTVPRLIEPNLSIQFIVSKIRKYQDTPAVKRNTVCVSIPDRRKFSFTLRIRMYGLTDLPHIQFTVFALYTDGGGSQDSEQTNDIDENDRYQNHQYCQTEKSLGYLMSRILNVR